MVRIKNVDEREPLSPDPRTPLPEIFSTRKKVYAVNSDRDTSYSFVHHSEIPKAEPDYFPREIVSRQLFQQQRCQRCDCDCTSDGCGGCLRRNRQCLWAALAIFVTSTSVLLLFSSLSYNLTRQHGNPSVSTEAQWIFHRHVYRENATVGEIVILAEEPPTLQPRAPVKLIDDPREPNDGVYHPHQTEIWDESENFRKKRSLEYLKPIHDVKSKYDSFLKQVNEIEDSLKNYKLETRKPIPGFEPFSMVFTTMSPDRSAENEIDYEGDIGPDAVDGEFGLFNSHEDEIKANDNPVTEVSPISENNEETATTPLDEQLKASDTDSASTDTETNKAAGNVHVNTDNHPVMSLAEAKKKLEEKLKASGVKTRTREGSIESNIPSGPDQPVPLFTVDNGSNKQTPFFLKPIGTSEVVLPHLICYFSKNAPPASSTQPRTFPLPPPLFPQYGSFDRNLNTEAPNQMNFYNVNIIVNHNNDDNTYLNSPTESENSASTTLPPQFLSKQLIDQPLICRYPSQPYYQFPTMSGGSGSGDAKSVDTDMPTAIKSNNPSGKTLSCLEGSMSCTDGSSCIPLEQWCDNRVDCRDASDEAFCSCRERIGPQRLCDGYLDCPNGEDEVDCTDCPKTSMRCNSADGSEDGLDVCVPLSKRCDGDRHCPSGDDELDCSALFVYEQSNDTRDVSYSRGYLHRNWRGDWLPVCMENGASTWAREACASESAGAALRQVNVSSAPIPEHFKGPFLVHKEDGSAEVLQNCRGDRVAYVKCPVMQCGNRVYGKQTRFKRQPSAPAPLVHWLSSSLDAMREKHEGSEIEAERKKRGETLRVVGGKESEAQAWPWAVAIYEDGHFHCGGVVLDEKWILTAAHCVHEYWMHHYEIRAGMLRRFSFSPMEQVRAASDVIVHEKYDPNTMVNDVALLRLQRPLYFNRWVRAVCLPDFKENFSIPRPGMHCTAVGWGAVKERGVDPDQLREVEVPILSQCKRRVDIAGNEICAGVTEGGKDTCQGDSGGPLLCKSSHDSTSWYAAGIVSHGEGCARPNEPGAYTRVSLYTDWIAANANDFLLPDAKPLPKCPGMTCNSASRRCVPKKNVCNSYVDCIDGEDEQNCDNNWMVREALPEEEVVGNSTDISFDSDTENLDELSTEATSIASELYETTEVTIEKIFTYVNPKVEVKQSFLCAGIMQSINGDLRCDGIRDCEDGSDEFDCKCRDDLIVTRPDLLCDGRLDCEDLSDESECTECPEGYFNCKISRQCVLMENRCDSVIDCKFNEDELDCYILAQNTTTEVFDDKFETLITEGIVMSNKGGVWSRACQTQQFPLGSGLAMHMCSKLGTIGYEMYENVTDPTNPDCINLHVVCSQQLTSQLSFYGSQNKQFAWPWHGVLYKDGIMLCSTVLLESEWLLTSSECLKNMTLSENFITVELGVRNQKLRVIEYGNQIIRIDDVKPVPHTDMVLLHLDRSARTTQFVRPLGMPAVFDTDPDRDICIAVGGDGTAFLQQRSFCPSLSRCYTRVDSENHCSTKPWIGVIVCQSRLGWVPSSVFIERQGGCGFDVSAFSSVQEKLHELHSVISTPVQPQPVPDCHGLRCREGLCINPALICDGIADCYAGEDEEHSECDRIAINRKECKMSELKCTSGECIPKTKFGDGVPDCSDISDEPITSFCVDYLRLARPQLVCDGRRNCLDKSDEHPNSCPCTEFNFNCSKSGVCVPMDFVCDGEHDCPNGEDETSCVGYKRIGGTDTKEVEVIHKSYGEWHTQCGAPTLSDVDYDQFCTKTGYEKSNGSYVKRQIPSIIETNAFTSVKLNTYTTINLRGDRTFVNFLKSTEMCDTRIVECI